MSYMEDLNSPKALVCHQQHRADCGVGTIWFVLLADGYLIDCGSESHSEARAKLLAKVINESGPEIFERNSLNEYRA